MGNQEASEEPVRGKKEIALECRNIKITNFDVANEFVMRNYWEGWSL